MAWDDMAEELADARKAADDATRLLKTARGIASVWRRQKPRGVQPWDHDLSIMADLLMGAVVAHSREALECLNDVCSRAGVPVTGYED